MVVTLLLVLAALGVAWVVIARDGAGNRTVAEHSVDVPQTPRTVALSTTMPSPSAHERHLSAMLERGAMPQGPMMAEVLTDTECAPDVQMISRCRNEVRLADGRTMVLRHPHDMRTIPCLAPSEQVLLLPPS